MVQSNREVIETKRKEGIARRRDQFSFHHHRTRAQHVNITLIKLTKAPARRPVGAPDGLNLIALEEFRQFVLILRDDTRQGHGQIVAQSEVRRAALLMFTALEDFED